MENKTNYSPYLIAGGLALAAIVALAFIPATIKAQETSQDSGGFFCTVFFGGCDEKTNDTQVTVAPVTASSNGGGFWSGLFGSSDDKPTAVITVVSVPDSGEVYRIVYGKKHLIPTAEIFASYGLRSSIVRPITSAELEKYPRARLFIIQGDESARVYYLTDGGFIRPMINDKAFYSYGNRKEDIIAINLKEFNYYPRAQFVFVDKPSVNRDIYQITGGVKRYVAPAAVERMGIRPQDISPVSIVELEQYPTGEPIIY